MLTVTVSPEHGGMVTVNGESPTAFPANIRVADESVVQLTAVPLSGFAFVEWSGDVNSGANAVSLTMTCDQAVTAVFQAEPSGGDDDGEDPPEAGDEGSDGGDGDDGGGCFMNTVFNGMVLR